MAFDRVQRNLWMITLAAGISRFGDHFQTLAVTTLTYALTGSPMAAALQMAMGGIPFVLWSRWTGRAADRFDNQKLFALANLLRFLLTLLYIPTNDPTTILALNFAGSSVAAFAAPARARLLRQLVGKENLMKANARQSTITGTVELVGPIVAGAFLVHSAPGWAFLVNALSYLAPALAMAFVHQVESLEPAAAEAGARADGPWAILKARPDILLLLLGNAAFQLGMWAINALFYPFVADVLHRGADVLGWSISAYFGASLLVGPVMERWGHKLRRNGLMFLGFGFASLVWLGYTFAYNVPLMLALSVFDGIVFTLASVLFNTRVQEEAPGHALGRVFAAATAWQETACFVGMLGGGWLATAWGILPGMRFFAVLTLVLLLPLPFVGARLRRRAAAISSAS
ncbi:MAG: major facilitator superfamily 1 [Symbiobacteriaceae bacterium]|jgi:MFS family permease|nr:major facilitator superfamily 1 [Symbiobacteriaceae bacterium]